ncbi:hypothetical protein EW146_g1611 [Bondarzewia mesenterica]|uniref:PX domain-containing protein n=1 Tax=Bondarzewia mesenterica TaxID=1095465 RepID=A0A4S4M4Q7_9AGAM|nr:hypothetical protein EW146_g1611 [Bondarzewia mesenterica]
MQFTCCLQEEWAFSGNLTEVEDLLSVDNDILSAPTVAAIKVASTPFVPRLSSKLRNKTTLAIQLGIKETLILTGTTSGMTDRDFDLKKQDVLDRCGVVITAKTEYTYIYANLLSLAALLTSFSACPLHRARLRLVYLSLLGDPSKHGTWVIRMLDLDHLDSSAVRALNLIEVGEMRALRPLFPIFFNSFVTSQFILAERRPRVSREMSQRCAPAFFDTRITAPSSTPYATPNMPSKSRHNRVQPTRPVLRMDAQEGSWTASVAENPHHPTSYSLYVKMTHNLTLSCTAREIVELHHKLRDLHPGVTLPQLPIPTILPGFSRLQICQWPSSVVLPLQLTPMLRPSSPPPFTKHGGLMIVKEQQNGDAVNGEEDLPRVHKDIQEEGTGEVSAAPEEAQEAQSAVEGRSETPAPQKPPLILQPHPLKHR